MPRFSANLTLLFTELPFLDRFAAAAAAGFRAVEFVSPYAFPQDEVAARVREHRLAVSVMNLPPGDWERGDRGMACDPRRVAEFREGVPRAVAWARAIGCDRLHAMAGIRPPGVPEALLRATYVENLRFAADALAREGLVLLVEAINDRDMPGYFLTTSRQAFEVMDAVGASNLSFQFDAYHLHIMEGGLQGTLDRRLDRIGHVQIADAPGRHEPGTGEIDFGTLLPRLDALGYGGWVGCEYRPAGETVAGLGWMQRFLESTARGAAEMP